jgi:hypothetical protein
LTTCMEALPEPKVSSYTAATASAFAAKSIDDRKWHTLSLTPSHTKEDLTKLDI